MTSRILRVSSNHYHEHAAPSFEAKYSVLPLDTNIHSPPTLRQSLGESSCFNHEAIISLAQQLPSVIMIKPTEG